MPPSDDVLARAERRVKELRVALDAQAALVRAFSQWGRTQATAEARATLEALQTALVLAEWHLRAECHARKPPRRHHGQQQTRGCNGVST